MEFYKTFVREEDQSKYAIPMQFHVFGRVVVSRPGRWSAGGAIVLAVGCVAVWLRSLGEAGALPSATVVLVGSAGGWVSAIGGAWKDAPIEGFDGPKFLRSPAVAAVWAWALAGLADDLLVIGLGALGYTVATIETYKTFFFPSRPRGKFAGKPIAYAELLRFRQRFVPLYVATWTLIALALSLAFHAGALPEEGDARVAAEEPIGGARGANPEGAA